jgi:hypothetical protein
MMVATLVVPPVEIDQPLETDHAYVSARPCALCASTVAVMAPPGGAGMPVKDRLRITGAGLFTVLRAMVPTTDLLWVSVTVTVAVPAAV